MFFLLETIYIHILEGWSYLMPGQCHIPMYLYAVNVSMYVHPSSWYHPSLIKLEFPPPSVALSEDCPHCTWRVLVWSPMPWHRFGWIHRKFTWKPQKSPLPEGKSSSKNGFFLSSSSLFSGFNTLWWTTMAGISAYSAWYIFKREKMFGPAMSSSECRVFCSSQTLQAKGLFIPTVGWFGFGGLKCRLKSWQFLPNDWLGIPVFCSKPLIS